MWINIIREKNKKTDKLTLQFTDFVCLFVYLHLVNWVPMIKFIIYFFGFIFSKSPTTHNCSTFVCHQPLPGLWKHLQPHTSSASWGHLEGYISFLSLFFFPSSHLKSSKVVAKICNCNSLHNKSEVSVKRLRSCHSWQELFWNTAMVREQNYCWLPQEETTYRSSLEQRRWKTRLASTIITTWLTQFS